MKVYCKISKRNTLKGKGGEKMFPQVLTYSKIGSDQILEMMERNAGVKPGETMKAMTGLNQVICEMLSNGHRVQINGLGTFAVSVKGEIKKKDNGSLALENAYINKVIYTPDASLMKELRAVSVLLLSQQVDENGSLTDDSALDAALGVLEKEGVILSETFAKECGVSREYARQWLERLTQAGLLKRTGSKNRYVYLENS